MQPATEGLPQAVSPAALLLEELPQDWSAEERLLFTNWLRQIVSAHEALTNTCADRPGVLWRAVKMCQKLRTAFVRAALIAERDTKRASKQVRS